MTTQNIITAVKYALKIICQDKHHFYRLESAMQYLISTSLREQCIKKKWNIKIYTEARIGNQKIDILVKIGDIITAIEVKYYYRDRPMKDTEPSYVLKDIDKVKNLIQNKSCIDDININEAFAVLVLGGEETDYIEDKKRNTTPNIKNIEFFRKATNENNLNATISLKLEKKTIECSFDNVKLIWHTHKSSNSRFYIVKFPQDPIN